VGPRALPHGVRDYKFPAMTDHAARPLWSPPVFTDENEPRMREVFRALRRLYDDAPEADAPYAAWHAWSVEHPDRFWTWLIKGEALIVEGDTAPALVRGERMAPPGPDGPQWFPRLRLNFAENALRAKGGHRAIIARDERGVRRELSGTEVRDLVRQLAGALRAAGVVPGDRVVGFLPNIPEAIIAALAANAVGAVWSSCSPDFGVNGVLDRFGQIEPKVLVCADGYTYAGKRIDCLERTAAIVATLPSVREVVRVSFLADDEAERLAAKHLPQAVRWDDFVARGADAPMRFERLPFDHPLYIMYSSGTTGLPKCMVHGQGGTLLQHVKEHALHCDLQSWDTMFYFTTCGWMMWNWLLSALVRGTTIVLYDGAPLPDANPGILWDLAQDETVTHFGTSAKFLAMSEKLGLTPAKTHDLSELRMILSTGSPLAEHSYDYVYEQVKPGVQLASISGGTDLISCFALGNPMLPVYRGELQCRGLGMAVDVWDEAGKPLRGAAGELVCTKPFPSMPVAFWNDPDGSKYRAAYFDFFPGVWRHGDWAEITEHDGLVIHGRSDATLNPGGVRIGTAEIYRQVEQMPEILESVVVGQDIGSGADKDVQIVLFVRLRAGHTLDDALRDRIKKTIRAATSPHHVPKRIEAVADIPRTISGKISEIAVRDVLHGRVVKNTDALANPGALELFRVYSSQ